MKDKTLAYITMNPGCTVKQIVDNLYSPGSTGNIYREIKDLRAVGKVIKVGSILFPENYDVAKLAAEPSQLPLPDESPLSDDYVYFKLPTGVTTDLLHKVKVGDDLLVDWKPEAEIDDADLPKQKMISIRNLIYIIQRERSFQDHPWILTVRRNHDESQPD